MSDLPSFDTLYEQAEQNSAPVAVAAAGGADETVLEAMSQATERGWIHPILCGSEVEIRRLADAREISLDSFTLVDSEEPAVDAVRCVQSGQAALLMKGQVATPDLMRAVLNRETGLRTERIICQMVLMEIPRDDKRFLMTDTGITIRPSLGQKQDLLRHIVETATRLGSESPRIALMAATEKPNEAMPDTLDAEPLMTYARQTWDDRCAVSGPLSFDLAYATRAGARKNIDDPVAGHADGMLFPDLLSANLTVKAIMYTADCRFGGILCGTSAPVVFMSRADDTVTRLNSLAYALQIVRNH
ncbi:phosphate acyltransferase [Rubinisphaera margarita]|uniref:phosphate acyltransferase n=1 Tax=Rubinisphaera margarita TaxID=2909586 RepID=UPI001EE89779|nr:phosphate acyltransferase [Rubinisphaera margarita]MCG6156286.1 phosphate butyryltransferase [Rubinisphaera margarita]